MFSSSFFPVVGKPCMRLRTAMVREYADCVGKNVNIQRKASIPSKSRIGEKSVIGVFTKIAGPITIGKYVNMGAKCIVFTINHGHDRTDITMKKQGYTKPAEVVICNDI